jgi:talin
MVASAKAAVPTVGDAAAALSLSNAVKNLNAALAELRAAAAKVHDSSSTTSCIDAALEQVRALEAELTELRRTLGTGQVAPLPGETADSCATLLGSTSKTVGSSMAQLLTAAAQVTVIKSSLIHSLKNNGRDSNV